MHWPVSALVWFIKLPVIFPIYKVWYGLSFFERTNVRGNYVVAAYHHPDSITWRWSFWYDSRDCGSFRFPKIGPGYSSGTSWRSPRGNISFWIRLPLIGGFTFNTQEHMWRKP